MSETRTIYRLRDVLEVARSPIVMKDEDDYMLASIRRRNGGMFDRETKKGREILTKTLNRVIPGSFVISKMQVVHGACGMAPLDFGDRCISASYTSLLPTEPQRIDIGYLDAYATTKQSYDAFFRASHGVHIEKMTFNLEEWLNGEIELPPLPEQKKIAEILSGIDKAINKILQAIAKSEITLTGVFANLDFIASSGKSGTLGEVARVQNGYAFQSSIFSEDPADIPLVRISNISGGEVDISKSKRIPRGIAPSDEYRVNKGDILIAMSGATTGKIGKYQGDAFCLLNQRVGKFVFRPGSDSATYVTQLLLSGFLESRILAKAAGGAQPNISGKGIEDINIPFPDAADQGKYGGAIKELLRVNSRRRILVEKYQHLKDSITSDLLSGRKRVTV
ncbi:restriction endonuclease subunit S [Cyanobium sp. FGCU-6]|nr:restriction endonuclease subunit S [Cyanobium sp. FGCU6]